MMLGYPRGWADLHVYAIYCVPEFHDCDCKRETSSLGSKLLGQTVESTHRNLAGLERDPGSSPSRQKIRADWTLNW